MNGSRVLRDLKVLATSVENFSDRQIKLKEDYDLQHLELRVRPSDGPYYGGTFVFAMDLYQYPEFAPKVTCLTKIYHPNIDPFETENVCLNILQEGWSCDLTLEDVAQGLLFLMHNPNFQDPLNPLFEPGMDIEDCLGNIRKSLNGEEIEGFHFGYNFTTVGLYSEDELAHDDEGFSREGKPALNNGEELYGDDEDNEHYILNKVTCTDQNPSINGNNTYEIADDNAEAENFSPITIHKTLPEVPSSPTHVVSQEMTRITTRRVLHRMLYSMKQSISRGISLSTICRLSQRPLCSHPVTLLAVPYSSICRMSQDIASTFTALISQGIYDNATHRVLYSDENTHRESSTLENCTCKNRAKITACLKSNLVESKILKILRNDDEINLIIYVCNESQVQKMSEQCIKSMHNVNVDTCDPPTKTIDSSVDVMLGLLMIFLGYGYPYS